MIWFVIDPSRSRQEREAIEALVSASDWLIPGEWRINSSMRLIWDADIAVGDHTRPISLQYPNHFPHSPPVVLPRGDTTRWSSHQYGAGGELCLEYGPDNWHPDITGAAIIESAHRLLSGENPSGEQPGSVASRHATTLGQDLAYKSRRLALTAELKSFVSQLPPNTACKGTITLRFCDGSVLYTIGTIELAGEENWRDTSVPQTVAEEGYNKDVAIATWPDDLPLPSKDSRSAFRSTFEASGMVLPDVNYVLLKQNETFRAYFLPEEGAVALISIVPAQPEGNRLNEDHAALKDRNVALAGCGSLGSKVAMMLARAGVTGFLLIDDDIMLPDNLVRHDLDWREVAAHKVDGLARRIRLVNPDAQCNTRPYRLGGQQSSGSLETLIGTISKCDLIIDATADPKVFNYLCAAAEIGKRPLIWAEVFGGGIGGLIARHRPGIEPRPATMRAQIEQWCRDQGKPIERAPGQYETEIDGVPMIADDADVSAIASHAARLAIDTAIPRDPSIFPHSVYLIGLAQGWIFDQPFDTRPIEIGVPDDQPATPVDPQLAQEEIARTIELFTKYANEADPQSTRSAPAAD